MSDETTSAGGSIMKTPSHSSPSYVCARIRKLFAAKGWPLHKVSGRYTPFGGGQTSTEGFAITKVGCSKSVAIHYHGASPDYLSREVKQARRIEAAEYLRSLGYCVSDIGWIECDGYDSCDR